MEHNQNQIYSLCPKCSKDVPRIEFDEDDHDKLMLSCKCGFYINCDISTYINIYKKHPIPISPSINHCKKHNLYYKYYCDTCNLHFCKKCVVKHSHDIIWKIKIENKENISELRLQLKKCYNHLNKYFSSLKNKAILTSPNLKSKIIQSYKQCYKRNKSILDFYTIIFDNYFAHNFSIEKFFKEFVTLNVYPYIADKDAKSVCNYFDTYSFYRAKETKIIIKGDDIIDSLLILQDKRLAATLERDPLLMIFDPKNNYHCDIVIRDNKEIGLNSICQLDNGHIVTCGRDNYIKIYSITKNTYKCEFEIANAHQLERYIATIINLPNNRIASCGEDSIIKIWDLSFPYDKNSNKLIKELIGHESFVYSLLYLKERDILISGGFSEAIRFWNATNYQCISVIMDINVTWMNCMYMLDESRLIVGECGRMSIINIDKFEVEERIEDIKKSKEDDIGRGIYCFMKLRDGNTLLCGTESGDYIYYNLSSKKMINFSTTHENGITDILKIDEHSYYTTSNDLKVRIWKY